MKLYRCSICGDPYMGTERPSHCPFCGAPAEYLVDGAAWVDENRDIGELSEISIGNLEQALQLEANNFPFYKDAAKKADDLELQAIFRYLARIEREHAAILRKILRTEIPSAEEGKEVALDGAMDNIEAAHSREVAATDFYQRAAKQAVEPRVKKVFSALALIEADHVALEGRLLER